MATKSLSAHMAEGNTPTMILQPLPLISHASRMTAEAIEESHERGLAALEVIAFLHEALEGYGGDPLNLSSEARDGLVTILGDIRATVGEVAGALGSFTTAE